jgi:hypothetical protein
MLNKIGMKPRDLYELPTSTKTFPDGCHYRIEHCASSNKEAFEALIAESEKRDVPIHRLIVGIRGLGNFMSNEEVAELARMGKENRIEIVVWAGLDYYVRPSVASLRLCGMDQIANVIKVVRTYIDLGFRSFFITDEGLLWALSELRKAGEIPKDVRLKASGIMGHGNPCSARVVEMLGADSFNPTPDVSLPVIASIRSAVNIPLDIYVHLFSNVSLFPNSPEQTRFTETPEIARIAAPVNLKLEPDLPPFRGYMYDYIGGPNSVSFAKKKVQESQLIKEMVEKYCPEVKLSKRGPEDLAIPV